MLTVPLLLLVAAFVVAVASAMGKAPLWVAVLLVIVERLITAVGVK